MSQKRKLPTKNSTTRHVTFDVEHNDVHLIKSLKEEDKTGLWLSNYERTRILRRAESLALEMHSILHPAVIEWIYNDSIRGLEYMAAATKHMTNESRVATTIWKLNYSDDDDCNNKMMEKKVETKKKLTREESLNKALFAYLKRRRRAAESARRRAESDKKFVDDNIIRYNTNNDRKELPHPPRLTPFIFCQM